MRVYEAEKPTFEQLEAIGRMTPSERRFIFKDPYSFLYFFAFYFSEYFKAPFADFHLDMAEDLGDLETGKIRELGWFTFRESAKSAFAMAYLVKCICNGTFQYPNVDANERDNSERFLFDVVNNLQTNRLILADYGQLFNEVSKTNEKTQKRVTDFVTTSGIRVEAHTTGSPIRGRRHRESRPDLIIADDIENLSTLRSDAATKEVREHLAEMKGGIDQKDGRVIYLGNKLSEDGNIASLVERSKGDPMFRVREIWILKDDGTPSWPERHVLTDAELIEHPDKISIETIRRGMYDPDTGDANFEREMQGVVIDPTGDGADAQGYFALFKPDLIRITGSPFSKNNAPFVIGVDPAGEGTDLTAVVVRSAFQAKLYATEAKSSGKSVAQLVIRAMNEYSVPARSVVIDAFGVGFKTVKELALLGHNVMAVNVGEKDKAGDGYMNDRAYMFFLFRDWMGQGGELCDDPCWKQELRSIRFFSDEKGVKRIIPKKEILKRGFKSPNATDATALSFLAEFGRRTRTHKQSGEYNPFEII